MNTLDDFFIGTSRRVPQAVKIDVEGWEEEVLRGGERFFAEVRPRLVVLERANRILTAMNHSWEEIQGFLERFVYRATSELEIDVVFQLRSVR